MITNVLVGFAVVWLLSHYEFSQSVKAVCVCIFFVCVCVCVPVFSSISLDLLPERTATLMVYEEVVEIVSGVQGKKTIPAFTFTHSDEITWPCTIKNKRNFKLGFVMGHMTSSTFHLFGPLSFS